jgi:pimeloyl-ACP methyl ester carboxylesterase
MALVGLLAAALCAIVPGVAQATNANFLGAWSSSAGGWTIASQAPDGSCTGTSTFGYEMTNCHVTGNSYEFLLVSGGYESQNHGTIEGNNATGEFTDTAGHTNVEYTAVRAGAGTTVAGSILNQKKDPAEGVTVTLTGTTDTSEAVTKTTKTSSIGAYSFEVSAGTYAVKASGDPPEQNGGELAVSTGPSGPDCSGTAKEATCTLNHLETGGQGSADFTYTQCGITAREADKKEPTGCPIIFIPGILGSRIDCGKNDSEEIYPNLPNTKFSEMELQPDGETNLRKSKDCEAEANTPAGEAGLFTSSVFSGDIYEGAYNFIKRIATNGAYVYPFDWRRGVTVAAAGLKGLVNEVLTETKAKHVVIVAHSMGGLVTQAYIAEGGAEKVSRAVTIGTPYWGAPKSLIALMNGYSNEFALESADKVFSPPAVQKAVRNYTGLFWLYPSTNYGPWLQIVGGGFSSQPVGGKDVGPWVTSLGGNAALLDRAEAGHEKLDGFKPEGVDYQIVVGTGLATITSMKIGVTPFEPEQFVQAKYGSGDSTVPARSQTQGAYPSTSTSGPVKIHYACGVKHSDEPGNGAIQSRIKDFLLTGGEITEPQAPCEYGGAEIVLYKTKIAGNGKAAAVKSPGSPSMTISEAAAKGLIQMFELGGRTVLTTNDREPVTLSVSGTGLTLRVRSIGNNKEGNAQYFGPISGAITINAAGAIAQGKKKLRPHSAAAAPHVVASVTRRGKRYLVRLSSHGAVGGIYTRIGKSARHRYSKPLLLTATQLKQLRFAGVSEFGVWERSQRAHLPH